MCQDRSTTKILGNSNQSEVRLCTHLRWRTYSKPRVSVLFDRQLTDGKTAEPDGSQQKSMSVVKWIRRSVIHDGTDKMEMAMVV